MFIQNKFDIKTQKRLFDFRNVLEQYLQKQCDRQQVVNLLNVVLLGEQYDSEGILKSLLNAKISKNFESEKVQML